MSDSSTVDVSEPGQRPAAELVIEPVPARPAPDGAAETGLSPLGIAVSESLGTARYLLLVIAPIGAVVGAAIAAYDFVVNELLWAHISEQGLWLQMISPVIGMSLAGCLLQFFRVRSSSMADEVVSAYHDPKAMMPVEMAAGKLAASVATMGFGASAGMEGASKWLGATLGFLVQRFCSRFAATRFSQRTSLLAGASAGIAAIFRAPLSGAIMGVESPYKHDLAHEALVPALVSSAVSFWTFTSFRPATPYFPITFEYHATSRDLLVAVPLGLSAGIASHLFLGLLARLRSAFTRGFPRMAVRTTAGGLLLLALAYLGYRLLGAPVTLHAGLPVANAMLNGQYVFGACLLIFVLKLAATAITFGSGGVGGLFVPTATIGAALGACWDAAVPSAQPGVFTLLGIAAFAGASYNSLLFSVVFIAEATGDVFLVVPALIASTVAFVTTAGISNSRAQRVRRPQTEDRLARIPLSEVMTRSIVTVLPAQPLTTFAHSVLLSHHFKALPVVEPCGTLRGMLRLEQLRAVPTDQWESVPIERVMQRNVRTLCANHSLADAKRVLQDGRADYVPIIDPLTYRLVGIVSSSDLHRAASIVESDLS